MPVLGASTPVAMPVNAVAPAITGTPTVGQTLSVSDGTWTNSPTGFTYQWKRGAAAISGANAASYLLVSGDNLNNVSCDVTATNAAGSATATSNSVAVTTGQTDNVLVANRFQIATVSATSVPNPYTSRRHHFASPQGDITNIKTVDFQYYINATFIIGAGGNWTIKRYIEYPVNVFHQVKWAGATTKQITAALAIHTSDVILSSVDGLPLTIPAGAKFWERTVVTAGTTVSAIELPASPVALGIEDGNVAADQGNSGTIAASSVVTSIGCLGMIGTVGAANARGFGIVGDSISFGTGDVTGFGAMGSTGWPARLIDPSYPSIKFAKGGMAAFNITGDSTNAKNLYANAMTAVGATDTLVQMGAGDLRQAGNPYTTVETNVTALATIVGTGRRNYGTTYLPRTDSTDSWATTANQTPKTDGDWAHLSTLNDDVRAHLSGFIGHVEAADVAMTSRNSGIWPAPPVPSLDGVHPVSAEAAVIAAGCTVPSA
jgi:hypothetical protein